MTCHVTDISARYDNWPMVEQYTILILIHL